MTKSNRTYIRIDPGLKKWAQAYAKRRNTTISELFTRFLTNLQEHDKQSKKTADAPQI